MATSRICSIPNCGKPHRARGYCGKHLMRLYTHGDVTTTRAYEGDLCKVGGCEAEARSLGMCRKHYVRFLRHGDADALAKTPNGVKRKWIEDHARHQGDECLRFPFKLWVKNTCGIRVDGRPISAFRYMCELAHGPAPEGDYDSAHSCGKAHEACINPNHLRWATPQENMDDQWQHGTRMKGQAVPQAKLCEADVKAIRSMKGQKLQKEIAAMFGVSRSLIGYIHAGKSWAWL